MPSRARPTRRNNLGKSLKDSFVREPDHRYKGHNTMLLAYQYNSFDLLSGSRCGWVLIMTQILMDECRMSMQGIATFRRYGAQSKDP